MLRKSTLNWQTNTALKRNIGKKNIPLIDNTNTNTDTDTDTNTNTNTDTDTHKYSIAEKEPLLKNHVIISHVMSKYKYSSLEYSYLYLCFVFRICALYFVLFSPVIGVLPTGQSTQGSFLSYAIMK